MPPGEPLPSALQGGSRGDIQASGHPLSTQTPTPPEHPDSQWGLGRPWQGVGAGKETFQQGLSHLPPLGSGRQAECAFVSVTVGLCLSPPLCAVYLEVTVHVS